MSRAARFRLAARFASLGAVAIGATALVLQSSDVLPVAHTMKFGPLAIAPATAAALVLAGSALGLRMPGRRLSTALADVFAAGVVLVMIVGMFAPRVGLVRPAYNTLAALFLLSGALLVMDRAKGRVPPFQWLSIAGGLLALMATAGYVYGSPHLYRAVEHDWGMSAITALGLLVLASGILCARPEEGLIAPLTRDDVRGRTLRWLLPMLPVLALTTLGLTALARSEPRYLPTVAAVLAGVGMVFAAWLVVGFANTLARKAAIEEQWQRIFDSTSDPVIETSCDGTVLRWNPASERLYGYSASEIVGRSIALVIPPDIQPAAWALRSEVVAQRQSRVFEGLRLRKDGSSFYGATTLSPVLDARGEVVGISAITHDLTARIAAEDVIKRAHESERQLREALEHNRDQLQESENRFRTLTEAMPQIVWITRPDGWNTYFNQQWVTYTGLTLEQSYAHGWNIPFHPDDRQRAWDAWQHAVQTDSAYSLECRLRRADGAYRWWLIRGVSLHDASGKVLNWFGTCTDIEDIKRTEEALRQARDQAESTNEKLRETEERLRLTIDEAPIGMALVALDGRFVRVNSALCEIVGYSASELTGLTFQAITHPDDLGDDLTLLGQLTRGEIPRYQLEKRYIRKDQTTADIQLNVSILRGRDGSPLYFIAQIEDIADRKCAEAERERLLQLEREHGARLQAIRESSLVISELQSAGEMKVPDVLRSVVEQARRLTGAEYGALGIGTDPSKRFDPWIFSGIPPEVAEQIGPTPRPVGVLGLVAEAHATLRLSRIADHAHSVGLPSNHPPMDAFLGVPIWHRGQVVGNLYLAKRPRGGFVHPG